MSDGSVPTVTNFKCKYCADYFLTSCLLKKHYLKNHKDKGDECSVCGKTFFSKKGLKEHLQQHTTINATWLDDTAQAVLDGQAPDESNLNANVREENICNYEYVVISSEITPDQEVTTVEIPTLEV